MKKLIDVIIIVILEARKTACPPVVTPVKDYITDKTVHYDKFALPRPMTY